MTKIRKILNKEVVRFLLVGVLATGVDLLVRVIFNSLFNDVLTKEWNLALSFTFGFVLSLILNYVLSTLYVFKGKRRLGDVKALTLFIVTSIFAFIVGLGLFYLCSFLFSLGNIDITSFNVFDIFTSFISLSFWMYLVSFIIQTLITLIINFILRKRVIYK